MQPKLLRLLTGLVFLCISIIANSQARLTIRNNSGREMTVKVMKENYNGGSLFKTVYISSYSSSTVYFSKTGDYFVKTKASLKGKAPIYKKGNPFEIYNGSDSYSVLTLTYTIKESNIPQADGGKTISKSEFDKN